MATLVSEGGALELFETSLRLPNASGYVWQNANAQVGAVYDAAGLSNLLSNIGSSPAWDWVRVCPRSDVGLWVQSCGRAEDGLVVEVNGPRVIIKSGAAPYPRTVAGTATWPYEASLAETHTVDEAVALQMSWLEHHRVPDGFEARATADRLSSWQRRP